MPSCNHCRPQILRRSKQRKRRFRCHRNRQQAQTKIGTFKRKTPPKSTISAGFWSEWRGSNARSPGPKPGAIPTSLHPDICFFVFWKFCCLWSKLWSDAILRCFSTDGQMPQATVSQRLPVFHPCPPRIVARHSQIKRDTTFATPGYLILFPYGSRAFDPYCDPYYFNLNFNFFKRPQRNSASFSPEKTQTVCVLGAPKPGAIPTSLYPDI